MLRIETEREEDGRWLAEVPALPGVLSYGATDTEARSKATALALRVIASGSKTAKRCRAILLACSSWHEPLAGRQGATGAGGAVADRLDRQTSERLAPHLAAAGVA